MRGATFDFEERSPDSPFTETMTRATSAHAPADAEFVGLQFRLGTSPLHLPHGGFVDDAVTVPRRLRDG